MIAQKRVGISLTSILFTALMYLIYKITELEGWTLLATLSKWIFYVSAVYVIIMAAFIFSIFLLGAIAVLILRRAKKKGYNIVVKKKFPFAAQAVPIDAHYKIKKTKEKQE